MANPRRNGLTSTADRSEEDDLLPRLLQVTTAEQVNAIGFAGEVPRRSRPGMP